MSPAWRPEEYMALKLAQESCQFALDRVHVAGGFTGDFFAAEAPPTSAKALIATQRATATDAAVLEKVNERAGMLSPFPSYLPLVRRSACPIWIRFAVGEESARRSPNTAAAVRRRAKSRRRPSTRSAPCPRPHRTAS